MAKPFPMYRDIRSDLRDRLTNAMTERDAHLAKAKEFENEVDYLTRLLDREEARFKNQKPAGAPKQPDQPLADYLVSLLETRPMIKDELREYATRAGYDVDGRSVHLTVVNLCRADPPRIKEMLSGIFAPADYEPTKPDIMPPLLRPGTNTDRQRGE